MEKVNVKVKKENEPKIGSFRLLLNMLWNSDDDIEAEWNAEPNRKILEEAQERVDKMQPKIVPSTATKKGKTRKISELTKNNLEVKKQLKIKDTSKDYNKDKLEEREHE